MKQKTLVETPQLKIQTSDDGVWLHFKASNGISASLNIALIKNEGTIVGQCLTQWAKDYALLNPPSLLTKKAEPPPVGWSELLDGELKI